MTVDIEKLEALARAATADCVKWYTIKQLKSRAVDVPAAELIAASNPAAVLELIAELRDAKDAAFGLKWAVGEFKAENAGLKTDYEAYERVNAELRAECEALRKDAGRYQWLCEKFGVTKLPCAVERILSGEIYVADGKLGVDCAIDAAMSKEQSHE